MKRPRKQCETGIPKAALAEAIREWDAANKTATRELVLGSPGSYVGSLPKYPTPGTPEYARCIQQWYAAWQQASRMDATYQQMGAMKQQIEMLTNQLGVLQGQMNEAEVVLVALTAAYTGCMNGIPV